MAKKKEGITKKAAKGSGKIAGDIAKGAIVGAATSIAAGAIVNVVEEKKLKEKAIKKAKESKKKLDESGIVERTKKETKKKFGKIRKRSES